MLQTAFAQNLSFENEKLKLHLETDDTSQNFKILAHFELKNDWHISWQNPGDAGVAPEFYFQNKKLDVLDQSIPERFLYQDLLEQYGYSKNAYYLFEIEQKQLPGQLKVLWTACQDYCEPESTFFDIGLSATDTYNKTYQIAQKTFPVQSPTPIEAEIKGDLLVLKTDETFNGSPYFIPFQKDLYAADSPQQIENLKNGTHITISTQPLEKIPNKGLIWLSKDEAYQVKVVPKRPSLLGLLLLAFLGGIILNLMPCVFPVLSIKAINMAQNAQQKERHIKAAFSYMFGVLACFALFASLLYAFKAAGHALGWGFQLQSPIFVGTMIIIFVLILLYLFDIINIRFPFLSALTKASSFHSFLTGFFAVLIASPCTGPFMGAALGYALIENSNYIFPIFLSFGFGYALPLCLLELFPKILSRIMPKPGKWMQHIKLLLSVPIIFTIFWLSWVLFHQLWQPSQTDIFETYQEDLVEQALENGESVLIDFTAKWCLTCLLNERTVFNSKSFQTKVKQKGIRLFKADWTNYDEKIFKALQNYQRSSIPLYVYYPKGSKEYMILPQILEHETVLTIMDTQNE